MLRKENIFTTIELDCISTAILNASSSHVAVIDNSGVLKAFNKSWQLFADESDENWSHPKLDENILTKLQAPLAQGNDFALRMLLGIKEVLNHEKDTFVTKNWRCFSGKKKWFKVSVSSLGEDNGAVIIYEDFSTEKALHASEQQYRMQFENTLEGTIIGRPDGLMLKVNPAACKMLGYSAEELEGKNQQLIFDEEHPINRKALEKRKKKSSYSGTVQFTHKDGHAIPAELSSVIFRDFDGSEKTIINMKDISSKMAIQQKLIQEKEFTESAVCSLPTAFFVFNGEGKMIRWNSMLEKDLGYGRDELSQKNVMDLIHPEDQEEVKRYLSSDFSGEQVSMELKCLTKNKEVLHYLISGTSFSQDNEIFIVGGGLNRNDFKQIENEKKRNDELLDQLFYNSPIGIVLVDADGNVQNINKSFSNIFGFQEEEIAGKALNKVIVPDFLDKHAETLSKMSFTGNSFQTETIRINKKGEEVPVLVGGVPVKVDGETIAIYGMYVDISHRKALEDQIVSLLEAEKEARLQMQDMFEEAPSAIAMLEGENHTFTFVNERYKELVGKKDLLGKTVHEILPELDEQGFVEHLDSCFKENTPCYFSEKKVYFNKGEHGDSNTHYLNCVYKPIQNEQDEVYGIFVEAVDVTEQVKARNIIKHSLDEKETLLNEVHHRVKNNLAIVSGLLELQILNSTDQNISSLLLSTQSRISTIANIHELLYQNESLSHVSFKQYIETVMGEKDELTEHGTHRIISNNELDDVCLNVNQAIPAGMLLNEILYFLDYLNEVNFDDPVYDLELKLMSEEGFVAIELTDLKQELFEHFDFQPGQQEDLRKELINVLLTQIHGTLKLMDHKLTIHFPKREVKGPHNALNT